MLKKLEAYIIKNDEIEKEFHSLTYLKKLPIDVVKLDREFIKSVSRKKERAIVEYVIKLTNELNLKIVAEGIENQEQLEFLKFNKNVIMEKNICLVSQLRRKSLKNY